MTSTPAATWVAALITIGMWSWLIDRSNPVFQVCSDLYIAFSFGYSIALEYTTFVKPALTKIAHGQWILVLGILLGLMIYARYWRPVEFLGRWSVSYFVGYGAGYVLAFTPAVFLGQVNGSFVRLWGGGQSIGASLNNWVLLLALLASLMYFFFTVRRDAPVIRQGSAIGRYMIMLGLGALFGSTILYRYSLLFGRVFFIFHNWLHVV